MLIMATAEAAAVTEAQTAEEEAAEEAAAAEEEEDEHEDEEEAVRQAAEVARMTGDRMYLEKRWPEVRPGAQDSALSYSANDSLMVSATRSKVMPERADVHDTGPSLG